MEKSDKVELIVYVILFIIFFGILSSLGLYIPIIFYGI